jgi:hypothetical protein
LSDPHGADGEYGTSPSGQINQAARLAGSSEVDLGTPRPSCADNPRPSRLHPRPADTSRRLSGAPGRGGRCPPRPGTTVASSPHDQIAMQDPTGRTPPGDAITASRFTRDFKPVLESWRDMANAYTSLAGRQTINREVGFVSPLSTVPRIRKTPTAYLDQVLPIAVGFVSSLHRLRQNAEISLVDSSQIT